MLSKKYFFLILILCFIISLIPTIGAYNVLCITLHPGKSHFLFLKPLAEELANRGHNVTVVSFYPQTNAPPNYHDISLDGILPNMDASLDISCIDDIPFRSVTRHLNTIIGWFMATSTLQELCNKVLQHKPFIDLMKSNEKFDVILIEYFGNDCMLSVAHMFASPIVGWSSQRILPWTYDKVGIPFNPSYTPSNFHAHGSHMNFWQRLESFFNYYILNIWFKYIIQSSEENDIKKYLLNDIPDLEVIGKMRTAVVLVNTHHTLNGVRISLPGIVEVGGLHLYNKEPLHPLPAKIKLLLDSSRNGVIYVSFGSILNIANMPKYKMNAFIKTFSELNQTVIWKWDKNAEIPSTLSDNIIFLNDWIPQRSVLSHPNLSAFVSHGGLMSMTEALDSGVPMVIIPIFGDQPSNAVYASEAGLGVAVPYHDIDEDILRRAYQEILQPSAKTKVLKLRDLWRDRPMTPMDTAIYEIERVARHGNNSIPKIQTRHIPGYQLLMLDIIAFIIIMFIIIIYLLFIFYEIVKRLMKTLSRENKFKSQ